MPPRSLLDERLRRAVETDGDRGTKLRHFPYRTPLPETPLDHLLELEPRLKTLLEDSRHATFRRHKIARRASSSLNPASRSSSTADVEAGPDGHVYPSLQNLEDIYNETHWSQTWTSYLALGVLSVFLAFPEDVQDLAMQELLLLIPASSFFLVRGLSAASGRRRAFSSGGVLLAVTLVVGNLGCFALTEVAARVQARAAEYHEAQRAQAERRAGDFAASQDTVSVFTYLPSVRTTDVATVIHEELVTEPQA